MRGSRTRPTRGDMFLAPLASEIEMYAPAQVHHGIVPSGDRNLHECGAERTAQRR